MISGTQVIDILGNTAGFESSRTAESQSHLERSRGEPISGPHMFPVARIVPFPTLGNSEEKRIMSK